VRDAVPKPLIPVLCVDDHAVVREGIAAIIDMQPDRVVVGAAATGEEALVLFHRHRPAVTLMDLQLPGISGLEAIKNIRADDPQARVIVLTMYEGDEDIFRALRAGAATYLLKNTLSDDLVRVVREVHSGEHPMTADVAVRLAARTTEPSLTLRETEVLTLLAKGMRNKEIGATLGITEETTHGYIKNIFSKLKVKDRTAAVTVALRRGIIHLSP
jgi:two-component system NarL family response regulator